MAFAEFWLVLSIGLFILKIIANKQIINGAVKNFIIILFIIGIIGFLTVESIIVYHGSKQEDDKTDYVLVLGAGLNGDKISQSLRLRLDKALEFNILNPDTKVIVSGGKGKNEDISEAEAMKTYLINNGMEEKLIIMEDKSTNTYENFKFSSYIIGEGKSTTVITNSFHMYRAKTIGEKLGFNTKCYAAKTGKISALNFYVREFFGVIKYWFIS